MGYRIEWVIEKNPNAKQSADFYEFYDEYQQEYGFVAFETYKRYCRSAIAHMKLGAVQDIVEESDESDDTEIKTFSRDKDKNELYIEAHSYSLRTIDDLIAYAEIDTDKWVCYKQTANKWGSKTNDCYQIKGWFRLKDPSEITPEEYAERFKSLVDGFEIDYTDYGFREPDSTGNLTEICLFDFHFGQLIWGEETTGIDYNVEIASKMFDETIEHFISRTAMETEKYLLPLGNDFFNSDSLFNATTKGTPQHEDITWKKSFVEAEKLFIRNIDKLSIVAPVDIVIIPGNHDEQRIFYMGQFLSAWYRNNERVNVILDYKPRQYYKWGNCLIGYTHGNKEVKGSLPILMCQEVPELFAMTKYQEWHTGHFHSYAEKKTRLASDSFGIREVIIPTLIPTAEYATKVGYKQMNEALCFVWNKWKGKIVTYHYHP